MKRYGIPEPDVLITSCGTEIHYAPKLTADTAWVRHIDHQLDAAGGAARARTTCPASKLQPRDAAEPLQDQLLHRSAQGAVLEEINSLLHKEEQTVNVILSFGQFLDMLPIRASKGFALRYFARSGTSRWSTSWWPAARAPTRT